MIDMIENCLVNTLIPINRLNYRQLYAKYQHIAWPCALLQHRPHAEVSGNGDRFIFLQPLTVFIC